MGNTLPNYACSQSDLLGEDCQCVTLAELHFSTVSEKTTFETRTRKANTSALLPSCISAGSLC